MKDTHIKITEGMMLASLPIAGYFLAYVYERGYCRFYEIPTSYIDITLINVISTIIAVISTYTLLFFFFNTIIYPSLTNAHRLIKWSLIKIGLVTFTLSGLAIVFNWSLDTSIRFILTALAFLTFLEFGFPLLTQRGVSGYLNKLEAQKEIDFQQDDLVDKFMFNFGPSMFFMLYAFFIISMATYIAGGANARFQTKHMLSSVDKNIVYLRKYGDFLIGNIFNSETNTLSNEFVIEPSNNKILLIKKIGQLMPYEDSSPNNTLNQTGEKESPAG